jgi:fatty-acyl-CoA synthase
VLTLGGGADHDLVVLAGREQASRIVLRSIDPEAICRIVYTGGTTGVPKAALASYRAMSTMFGIEIHDWQWPDELRMLLVAPLSHVGATCFTPTIVRGGCLYVERGFDPGQVLAAIEHHRITCILMVPTMISALLDHPRLHDFDLSSLETIFYGASPITPTRLRAAIAHFGPILFQFYGQAEAMTTVTTMRREDHDLSSDRRLASCGRPVRDMAVRLLDADGDEVPDGEPGELCVQGPLLMSGYLNKPAETAETLRGGWLHTGDVAVRDPDGFLRLVDRAKDMVITGGFNVYPRAVEDALEAHPGVASACVFGVPDDHWGEIVVAAVVLRDAETPIADLLAHVRARKGPVQTPKRIEVVERIPLTAVGKPDKKALRRMFAPQE